MKKNSVCLLLIAVLILSFVGCGRNNSNIVNENSSPAVSDVESFNAEQSLSEKLINEIDGAYSEDAKLPEYSATVGMIELANKYTEKWEQVADKYYNKIMEYDGIIKLSDDYYSSDDLHTFVLNMKTNWEQYNQVQCDNYMKTLRTIYASGTIVGPLYADYEYEMQKEWALQLVDIYEQLP